MRRQMIVILFLASLVGVSALSFGQDDAKANLEVQVQALSQEVAELRGILEDSEARMNEVHKYLKQNQTAAAELGRVLTASEAAGFTFGINPESRELLLAGWRKQLSAMQKGVPGTPAEAAAVPERGNARQPKRW